MKLLVYCGTIINMFPTIEKKKENRSRCAKGRDVMRLFSQASWRMLILYSFHETNHVTNTDRFMSCDDGLSSCRNQTDMGKRREL